mmetsp:Transcript_2283/g.5951  ORF Transcript_2283/g.5951 Transcript_2283/m.5951 type:complete len:304 (+) Transcript_2283:2612-3523(+)
MKDAIVVRMNFRKDNLILECQQRADVHLQGWRRQAVDVELFVGCWSRSRLPHREVLLAFFIRHVRSSSARRHGNVRTEASLIQSFEVSVLKHVGLRHHGLMFEHGEVLPRDTVIVVHDMHEAERFGVGLLQHRTSIRAEVGDSHQRPFVVIGACHVGGDRRSEASVGSAKGVVPGDSSIADGMGVLVEAVLEFGVLVVCEEPVGHARHGGGNQQQGRGDGPSPHPQLLGVASCLVAGALRRIRAGVIVLGGLRGVVDAAVRLRRGCRSRRPSIAGAVRAARCGCHHCTNTQEQRRWMSMRMWM